MHETQFDKLRKTLPTVTGQLYRAARKYFDTAPPEHLNPNNPHYREAKQLRLALSDFEHWLRQANAQTLLDTHPDQLYLSIAEVESPPSPPGDKAGSEPGTNTQTPQSVGP